MLMRNVSNIYKQYQTLTMVSLKWKQYATSIVDTLPKIHLVKGSPRVYSIRKIMKQRGRCSGVIQILQDLINNKNWINAWVELCEAEFDWFTILRIFWKKMLMHINE